MRALRFVLVLVAFVLAAHAVAFFLHEYSHSFTASALGWKSDPWRLNFGGPALLNLLLQLEIDERVDYAPIFAAGRGAQAALIAVAGVLSGAALYIAAAAGFLRMRERPLIALFLFWLCVMGLGNLIDYVPTRCFSPSSDMHTVEQGLGVGPWAVTLGLGLPFLLIAVHFFRRVTPQVRSVLQRGEAIATLAAASFVLFIFFPAAGLESGAGAEARAMAFTAMAVLFPLSMLLLLTPLLRPPKT